MWLKKHNFNSIKDTTKQFFKCQRCDLENTHAKKIIINLSPVKNNTLRVVRKKDFMGLGEVP